MKNKYQMNKVSKCCKVNESRFGTCANCGLPFVGVEREPFVPKEKEQKCEGNHCPINYGGKIIHSSTCPLSQPPQPTEWEIEFDKQFVGKYGGLGMSRETYKDIKSFIRTQLEEAVENYKNILMGVSQWRNHGEKWGYDDYFSGLARQSAYQEIVEMIQQYMNYYNPIGDEKNKGKHEALSDLALKLEEKMKIYE